MLTYLLYALIAFIVLIGLFLIAASMQPTDFSYARSTKIEAAPEAVFPHVNELKKWDAWSPWAKLDPKMKEEYAGPASGTGALHSWNGDANVGEGKMTIVESKPNEQIDIKLEFERPMKCANDVVFTFKPEGDQTLVTWTMTGKNTFMGKCMGLLMNMEKMIGAQFDQGLASMKSVVESEVKK